MVARAWLDSFTMILRCWLVVWVKWARPLSLWHCDPVSVQLKSGSIERRPFHGPSYTMKVNGANFITLLPPGGATFTPFWGMVLQSLPASSMWQISHFLKSTLWATGVKGFSQCKVNGATLGRSCPPGVQLLPHFEVWSYRAASSWNVANFTFLWNPLSELRGVKVFSMLSLYAFFLPLFAPGANIVPDRL